MPEYHLPYDPLVMKYFDAGKSFAYAPDDMFLSDDDFIELQWRIKGLDYHKGVAQLECVTHCEYDGARDWVSLDRLLKILEKDESL